MNPVSKTLIIIGVLFVLAGVFWHFTGGKIPLGRLPGDLHIETENTKVFIPITTSLLLSALLSLIIYLFRK